MVRLFQHHIGTVTLEVALCLKNGCITWFWLLLKYVVRSKKGMKKLRQNTVVQSKCSQKTTRSANRDLGDNPCYQIIPHIAYNEYIGFYRTAGIVALAGRKKAGTIIAFIPDVSTDSSSVNRLVKKMNRTKVPLIQLHDIVNDFIATQSF